MTTWLWTCRHTYEDTLAEELARLGMPAARTLLPGLVRTDALPVPDRAVLEHWDPVYALQVLPDARPVSAVSVKQLARAVMEMALPILQLAPTWQLHAVVPGQLKGTPKPPLRRRADLVAQAVLDLLKSEHRDLARRRARGGRPDALVQLLLLDPEHAWVSASPVLQLPADRANSATIGQCWPSALPAGLADVADDDVAPASSFRKLEEAFACFGAVPQANQTAVDLGASPGGWTRVLRRHGALVTAVDRAPLAQHLMDDAGVSFVRGDAFVWRPEQPVDWLVSDIVAFPERVVELLDAWCGAQACRNFVVQMKFKRGPDWAVLDAALDVARRHGFFVRARHFFNDKNEVTLLGSGPPPILPTATQEAEEEPR